MRRLAKLVAAFILLSILSGCATPMVVGLKKGPEHYVPSGDPNKGLIYAYRIWEYMGCLRGIYVTADGERIGALNAGTYFVYEADPGEVTISVENWMGKDPSRKINVEPGKRYYLKGSLKFGLMDVVPYIEIANDAEGEIVVQTLTYATLKSKK